MLAIMELFEEHCKTDGEQATLHLMDAQGNDTLEEGCMALGPSFSLVNLVAIAFLIIFYESSVSAFAPP